MLVAGTYDLDNWEDSFKDYLENNGMTSKTAKDYVNRIKKIIKDENITIHKLSVEIDDWIKEYKTGKYADINKKKHYAPSSSLIKFKDFFPTTFRQGWGKQTSAPYSGIFTNRTRIIY